MVYRISRSSNATKDSNSIHTRYLDAQKKMDSSICMCAVHPVGQPTVDVPTK